ncbi:MAG: 23S rRNA (guanosine(2251)-2'-O)-methyltransferase RlmB [Cyanobacteria bacterium SZAS LIN-5]|nr:23S rRNA (guanosine(2251)-2'-O)-methyltransferase RlmB [Cyanobacteria bacterium SZAS LIN-5]
MMPDRPRNNRGKPQDSRKFGNRENRGGGAREERWSPERGKPERREERGSEERGGFGRREERGTRERSEFARRVERGSQERGLEKRPDDGTEMIFGKNAVLAFLEDCERDEDASDDAHGENESENENEEVEREKTRNSAVGAERSRDAILKSPRGQVRKPEIGKIYMVALDHPDRKVDRIKQLAKSQRIPVVVCDRRKLDWLVGPDQLHQGIVAQISAAEFWELSHFLSKLKESCPDTLDGSVVAIVDGIEDPHNLGAIIRVAESAGLKGLLLPARRSAGLTGIVAKTSAGALASLPIVRIHNLVQALEELKEAGFWIAGLDSNQGDLYTKVDLVRPLALVVGSEGSGMSRLVKDNCDMLLKIPMLGKTESLNASVAAGIVFYEVVRQLQSKGLLS